MEGVIVGCLRVCGVWGLYVCRVLCASAVCECCVRVLCASAVCECCVCRASPWGALLSDHFCTLSTYASSPVGRQSARC